MRRTLALVIIILWAGELAFAVRNRPVASVPFEMVGSFVVINVSVNGSGRLRFILDTGVRNTIITELLPKIPWIWNTVACANCRGWVREM